MKLATRVLTSGLAAALALPAIAAAEDGEAVGTAAFESVEVTTDAGAILVNGVSTFGGETLVLGVDDAVDGAVPGAGTDITEMRLSQDPSSGNLVFEMDVDLAAGASAPVFTWSLPFGGGELDAPQLLAFANDASGVPGSFHFKLGTGGGISGSGGNFSVTDVSGRVEGSTLVWDVAPAALGLQPGAVVGVGAAPAYTTVGGANAGVTFISGSRIDEALITETFGVGGGARVKVLDTAGEVVDEGIARVRRGEFQIAFDGLDAGTYTVEVTTRYADAAVTESFTVTV